MDWTDITGEEHFGVFADDDGEKPPVRPLYSIARRILLILITLLVILSLMAPLLLPFFQPAPVRQYRPDGLQAFLPGVETALVLPA